MLRILIKSILLLILKKWSMSLMEIIKYNVLGIVGKLELCSIMKMKEDCELKGYSCLVNSFKISKAKKFVASGKFDMKMVVWDIELSFQYVVLGGYEEFA